MVGISTRVQDYLDDKIQNAADLDNVDELLAKVQQQQEILKKQVSFQRLSSWNPPSHWPSW